MSLPETKTKTRNTMNTETTMVAQELFSGSMKLGTVPGGGGAVGICEGSMLNAVAVRRWLMGT